MRHDFWVPLMFRPMLATLGEVPTGSRWWFEFKWDGVRAVVGVNGGAAVVAGTGSATDPSGAGFPGGTGAVRAMSRNDIDVTLSYPELLALPAQLGGASVVLDGEIVTLDRNGAPSFGLLQQRMHVRRPEPGLVSRYPVLYYAFDLLWLDGENVTGWPYRRRRETLERLKLRGRTPMAAPPRFAGPGQDVLRAAGDNGLEGVIAKAEDSTYEPGRRSLAWIKTPFNQNQDVIVIGWKPGAGRRAGMIGSLLLGAFDDAGRLAFIGHVGTGFTDRVLRDLADELEPLSRATSAVDAQPVPREHARHAHWVEPVLVGEVSFRTWTPDGRLRHAAWRGLRRDIDPAQVSMPA